MNRILFLALVACSGPAVGPDTGVEQNDAGRELRDAGRTRRDAGTDAAGTGDASSGDAGTSVAAIDLRDAELDIMPLGDSITLGVNGGYRNELYTRLVADGFDVDMVGSLSDEYTHVEDHDHEGHAGFTTTGIADNIDAWLSADPDVVLLMIGTNDLAWWIAEEVSAVADRLEALVDRILASRAGIFVVVGTIPPQAMMRVEPNDRERADLVVEYNQMIRDRFGSRTDVRVADINTTLTVDELYDGVHPTEAAHAEVARVWYETLRPLLPDP